MTEIMKAIKDLYELLIKKNDHYDVLVADYRKRSGELAQAKEALDAKEKELALREENIGILENAKKARIDAENIKKDAHIILEKAQDEWKATAEKCGQEKREAVAAMKNLQSSIDAVRDAEAKLKEDRKALEAEKLTYKNDIIKSFDRK